tara:strand:- start:378 stop:800 length:423 start_codon:yes stop_codon:yes gene_type:complete
MPIDRWLSKKVKYEEVLTIKDILEDMSDKTYEWIISQDDLSFVCDPDSFKNDFINLMYNYDIKHNYDMNHMSETEEDLYDLKYLEDINSLFLSLKNKDDYYNTNIIQGDFNELFEFIKYNTIIQEFNDSSDDEEEDLIES